MRTHVEFASSEFPAEPGEGEQINPGRFGKKLADYVAQHLPAYGFSVTAVDPEDWCWRVELANSEFPLWVGCGNYEEFQDGFLCFIEPSKPFVRRLFRKIDATAKVTELASALEALLLGSGKVSNLRWWSEAEACT
ncbi:MAG: hypothetical protein J0I77_13940 [Rudaea sp.]|uniref:hypothetical protein n=1 Tax=unclassified Rudaea TaxID=2627037 RepID=UPI0010F67DC4|nr:MULTISPECIES: hypothetical protein [unclassified Rudaea]MBN8886816.1 hypothetical protein [Rudaea sp.]